MRGQTADGNYRRGKMKCCGPLTRDPDPAGSPCPGAPGLRWLGLGPDLRPSRACSSCNGCSIATRSGPAAAATQLRRLLAGSDAVVSLWRGKRLVGFGRATSDGFNGAVLWDIVVAGDLQGHGLGRRVIEELLHTPPVVGVERVYLMTPKVPAHRNWASRMRTPSS